MVQKVQKKRKTSISLVETFIFHNPLLNIVLLVGEYNTSLPSVSLSHRRTFYGSRRFCESVYTAYADGRCADYIRIWLFMEFLWTTNTQG